jgi:hypothetical protein
MIWGLEDHVVERFTKAGVPSGRVSTERDTFYFESADQGPAEFIDLFKRYGPGAEHECERRHEDPCDLPARHRGAAGAAVRPTFGRAYRPAASVKANVPVWMWPSGPDVLHVTV